MKYLILVPDGAGDEEIAMLGNQTPLQAANLENMDRLARKGLVGLVRTIPPGIAPGSDAANLSVMGYDPAVYHTGRSPLEAASMGIEMLDTDVAFRTNLVTLAGDGEYENLTIEDHSAGDITSEEARILMEYIDEQLGTDRIRFYPGVSYRHAMIVKNGSTDYDLTPPHDVLTQRAGDHLPKGKGSEFITEMMKKSYELLSEHPVNKERKRKDSILQTPSGYGARAGNRLSPPSMINMESKNCHIGCGFDQGNRPVRRPLLRRCGGSNGNHSYKFQG